MWPGIRLQHKNLTLVLASFVLSACGNVTTEKKEILPPGVDPLQAILKSSDVSVSPGHADGITPTIVAVTLTNRAGTPLVGCVPTLTTGVGSDTVTCTNSNSSGISTCTVYSLVAGTRNARFRACKASIDFAMNVPAPPAPTSTAITSGGPCGDCSGGTAGGAIVTGTSGPNTFQIRPTIGALVASYPSGPASDQTTPTVGCYASADGTTPCNPGSSGGGSFQLLTGIRGVLLDTFGFTTD